MVMIPLHAYVEKSAGELTRYQKKYSLFTFVLLMIE